MDGPTNTPCRGCQRMELHKMCPAYGTPFYMSGIPFSKETQQNYEWLTGDNKLEYFNLLKAAYNNIILDRMVQENQEMGLYDKDIDNPLIRK